MKKLGQAGFSAIEGLLIVVILAILVGTGVYVYNAQHNANKTLETADKTGASQTQRIQKYLTIKEWGVKIPLSNSLSDAYYTAGSTSDVMYLSKNSYKSTDCAANATSLGAIEKSTSVPPAAANAKKIAGNYYSYVHPQAGCGYTNPSAKDLSTDPGGVKAGQYMLDFKNAVDGAVVG